MRNTFGSPPVPPIDPDDAVLNTDPELLDVDAVGNSTPLFPLPHAARSDGAPTTTAARAALKNRRRGISPAITDEGSHGTAECKGRVADHSLVDRR